MRVLLVTDWMSRPGGVELYVGWLRDGLRRAGDEVRLLTSSVAAQTESGADYVAFGTERRAAQALLQVANPLAAARVRSVLRGFRPDVVHLFMVEHHLSPAVLGGFGDVPAVLSVADYKHVCPTSWKLLPNGKLCDRPAGWVCHSSGCVSLPHWVRDRPRYALLRAGLRRVNKVLACSACVASALAAEGIAAEVLPLAVPPPGDEFRREPAADPLFVYCGRLSPEKGLSLLIRAFARLRASFPAAVLRVVGDGPTRPALERLTRELGLEACVTFTGWVASDRVDQHLRDAWALVAPSLHREPLGLVAIEALVRGVPVIASAEGGFAETVEDGVSGLLFPNGDERELLARLVSVAWRQSFPDHRVSEPVQARARARYAVGSHVEKVRAIYSDVSMPNARRPTASRSWARLPFSHTSP